MSLAITLPLTSIRGIFPTRQTGFSREAEILGDRLRAVHDEIQESIAVGDKKRIAREALIEVFNDTRLPNWDGYGAAPVSFESYCRADDFLRLLPTDLQIPDVSAHPDGEIAFEWRVPIGRILSISIGGGGAITFAGLFGATERHGVESFIDGIPSDILGLFGRLFAE